MFRVSYIPQEFLFFIASFGGGCFKPHSSTSTPAFSRCKQDSILNSEALYAMIDKLEYFYFYNEVEPASQPTVGWESRIESGDLLPKGF